MVFEWRDNTLAVRKLQLHQMHSVFVGRVAKGTHSVHGAHGQVP